VGPGNHVLDEVLDPAMARGNLGRKGHPIINFRDTAVSCAKMAEPIEMPFGLWAQMDPRNRVLGGSPEVQFWDAKWLLMGYNFGCIIANDTLFDSRQWIFGVKLFDENIVKIECLRVIAMATNFGTKIAITGFVRTIATR